METVSFKMSDVFRDEAEHLFKKEKKKILGRIPFAEVHHIAGTAIPGLLTKGDLDVNVRVPEDKFADTIAVLKGLYEVHQPDNWTKTFASFKDDGLELDLGVQLTVVDAEDDHFLKHKEMLLEDPKLVEKLNILKKSYDGRSMDDYRKAKGAFFQSL